MGIVVMILTGISLAMDAFAVSISCGLAQGKKSKTLSVAMKLALSFGIFQGMMIFLGWAFGLSFKDLISSYAHWIAFILLALIGGKMIYDSRSEEGCSISFDSLVTLMVLSIATSIDALAVGVSYSVINISFIDITITALIVASVTFAFCFGGTYVGAKIGCNPKFKARIDITGGLILVFIGAKILLESTVLI
ncbi:MAG: manganese efflux pump [Epulopiscium sp.]|nr:manganese efflux pump [Candidatus Epulonipiscium sp.]